MTTAWTPKGSDNRWTTADNWDNGIPGAQGKFNLDSANKTTLIDSSITTKCQSGTVGLSKNKTCRLEMSGGTFSLQDSLVIGSGESSSGVVSMSDGKLSIDNGYLTIGENGNGTLSINGGSITIKSKLSISIPTATLSPDATFSGRLDLHGGTVSCGSLEMGNASLIDVTTGMLTISGNCLDTLNAYVSNKQITAFNGSGQAIISYNPNTNQTYVTGAAKNIGQNTSSRRFYNQVQGSLDLRFDLDWKCIQCVWNTLIIIDRMYSAVWVSADGGDKQYITSLDYSNYTQETVVGSNGDKTMIITCSDTGTVKKPTMRQYFTLRQSGSFVAYVEIEGTSLSSNWMAPVMIASPGAININATSGTVPPNDYRALRFPGANSDNERYRALPLNSTDSGFNLLALYSNQNFTGLVFGAITHTDWKVGVQHSGSGNKTDYVCIYGGAKQNQDVLAHGPVKGNTIKSPKIYVGYQADWRQGMYEFTACCLENEDKRALPPSPNDGVPIQWKAGGGKEYALSVEKLTLKDAPQEQQDAYALGILEEIANYVVKLNAQGFCNERGTTYLVLDGGDDHLLSPDAMAQFAAYCHQRNLKFGGYFTPFKTKEKSTKELKANVDDTIPYKWYEIMLKKTKPSPGQTEFTNDDFVSDGDKYALDPTHPGTQQLNYNKIQEWLGAKLDYFRMDFTIMGTMEGYHFDESVTTGVQAYNIGMQKIADQVGNQMHSNLDIAPLFPYQYANSKRICTDAQDKIQDTEYQLNSTAYGSWWLERLYTYPDPGCCSFDPDGNEDNENDPSNMGYDPYEAKSRVIAVVINAGTMKNENDYTDTTLYYAINNPNNKNLTQYSITEPNVTRKAVQDLARMHKSFQPIEYNTGSYAPNSFVLQVDKVFYIAVFNFGKSPLSATVDLVRAGLTKDTQYKVTDLWDSTNAIAAVKNQMTVPLKPKEAALYKLQQ